MPQFFTVQFKQRIRVVAASLTMLAGAAPFVAGLLVMPVLGDVPKGPLPATITALSFLLGGLLPWLAQNLMGLAGNVGLQRRLRRHLEAGGCDLGAACFVGFSPGERLHIWQGETDRDIGFLTMTDSGLTYRGDEYSWTLPRDLIDNLDLTPSEAGLQRILIRWHVPREGGRAFSLESRDAASLSGSRRATVALFRRLREWQRANGADTLPAAAATSDRRGAEGLGFPPTDMTGAQIIEEPPSGSCASIVALGIIVVTITWRISGAFFACGQYYQGVLWAGLISVLGALSTGYLLHYLQAWEAEKGRQKQRVR